MPAHPRRSLIYKLHTDGGARGNPGPAGIGAVLEDDNGTVAELALGIGWATNNVAEYRALIEGLRLALSHGASSLTVFSDSLLLVQQMRGVYKVKHKGLKPLFVEAKELVDRFDRVTFEAVPREENSGADALVNQGIDDWLLANPDFVPPPTNEQQDLF